MMTLTLMGLWPDRMVTVLSVSLQELRREIARGVEQADRGDLLDDEQVLSGLHQRIDEIAGAAGDR